MDQYLSTVIIAIITGVFSVITLIIQKKQENVINKIDAQTLFIEKEKALKQRLTKKQAEREQIIHQVMIVILDTNLHILRNTMIAGAVIPDEKVFEKSNKLKEDFRRVTSEIQDINKEYEMLLELSGNLKTKKISKEEK